ncbi:uncharacterized protein AlacWU_01452 [Aspergillus niger]|uniref:uncharacterized protein n=1 Tax=Aspergillus lacticoffeatus (strain CBS 101883) TaxID=1450533 RepID=UPI000D7FE7C0|nr:uncharacterized protein BO96DRAFT_400279 [Aspergillus niger CBS 101883]PYH53254.1 hypothetical protein BO96DRAFT_400279 [Aspergillus niger CBS 101883]GJP88553.1 uncharacterized protein AlacWU_01452 [Aspergillus niger]
MSSGLKVQQSIYLHSIPSSPSEISCPPHAFLKCHDYSNIPPHSSPRSLQPSDRSTPIEVLGSYTTQLKTDYFGEGDSCTSNRWSWEPIDDPQSKFHNYTLSWTTAALTWSIEGTPTGFTKKTTDIRGGTKQQAWTSEMRDMPRDPAAGRTMY